MKCVWVCLSCMFVCSRRPLPSASFFFFFFFFFVFASRTGNVLKKRLYMTHTDDSGWLILTFVGAAEAEAVERLAAASFGSTGLRGGLPAPPPAPSPPPLLLPPLSTAAVAAVLCLLAVLRALATRPSPSLSDTIVESPPPPPLLALLRVL